MVATLGAAEAAADFADFGHGEDLLLDDVGDFVHLFEGGAGCGGGGDEGGLFLELGQEVLVHLRIERQRGDEEDDGEGEDDEGLAEGEAEEGALEEALEDADEVAVLVGDRICTAEIWRTQR